MNYRKDRLIFNAIPTVFQIANPPPAVTVKRKLVVRSEIPSKRPKHVAADANTTETTSASKLEQPQPQPTQKELKLQREVNRLRSQVYRLKQKLNKPIKGKAKVAILLNLLRQYLPENLVRFIETQIRVSSKKGSQIRWPNPDKMLALSIFYHSRKAYKLLSRLFKLPSVSTLKRTLKRTNVQPGFNENLFSALQRKVQSFDLDNRQCVLVFDEMSLESSLTYNSSADVIEGYEDFGDLGRTEFIANHATVFMVRGLKSKWKQPLCYFLSSGTISSDLLHKLTIRCIRKLFAIGLHVRATVCDQGSNNRSFLESKMGVSVQQPYFTVDGSRIYAFYDPPHLIKNIRNNMVKHGFRYKKCDIKWLYVVDFYNFDSRLGIRMAPKLTDFHINLRAFAAMRVNLATQVLSHTVAAGITTLIALGKINKKAQTTAEFINFFDQLFNVFNSKHIRSKQPNGHAISENSCHFAYLEKAFEYLSKLTLSNGRQVPCLEGWKMAINAVKLLWHDLHNDKNMKFQFLLTNRLNQDCIENLFSIVRGRGGNGYNPSPEQFRGAFRQIIVDQLLQKSESSNCKEDLDSVLLDLTSITCSPPTHIMPKVHVKLNLDENVSVSDVFSTEDGLAVENVACYMGGYVLKKTQITCVYCTKEFVLKSLPLRHKSYAFLRNKRYSHLCNLVYPALKFVKFIEELEIAYTSLFPGTSHMENVVHGLLENVRSKVDKLVSCQEAECKERVLYSVRLYFRIRIYAALKRTNSENKETKGTRNRKVLKLMHV